MKSLISVAISTVLLSGCVTPQPQMTREEWLEITTNEYQGVTKEEVLAATSEVIRLIDPDDVAFSHTENGFQADHHWNIYMVLSASSGVDRWVISVVETENGVDANLHLERTGGQSFGGSFGGVENGTFAYTLFWDRVDYLLGRRDDWITCKEAKLDRKAGKTYGSIELMCGSIVTENELPEGWSS